MRSVRRCTRGSCKHPAKSHQVVCDVLIVDSRETNSSPLRPPDALDLAKRPSACSSSASISSGWMKFSKLTTYGSVERACGSYSGKSESARSNVSAMACGGTAGGTSTGIGQRFLKSSWSHVPHDAAHLSFMYAGLFVHSPAAVHAAQLPLLSLSAHGAGSSLPALASLPLDVARLARSTPGLKQPQEAAQCKRIYCSCDAHAPVCDQYAQCSTAGSSAQLASESEPRARLKQAHTTNSAALDRHGASTAAIPFPGCSRQQHAWIV
mmetsp:Transcript_30377/g.63911  ORF Transcript_30377/g.63911 Transcript_30377/m.63911 type:complete len:266 (+) Transcript_30377:708-1505(+)